MNLSSFIFVEIYHKVSVGPQHSRQQGHSKNAFICHDLNNLSKRSRQAKKKTTCKREGKYPNYSIIHNNFERISVLTKMSR